MYAERTQSRLKVMRTARTMTVTKQVQTKRKRSSLHVSDLVKDGHSGCPIHTFVHEGKRSHHHSKRNGTLQSDLRVSPPSASLSSRFPRMRPLRRCCTRLRHSQLFKVSTTLIIAMNCYVLVLQTDSPKGEEIQWAEYFSLACVPFFICELLIRIGAKKRMKLDSWLILDAVACLASILEVVLDVVDKKEMGDIVVMVGVLRLFRLLRIARGIYNFRTMRLLVQSLYRPTGEGWMNTISVTLFLFLNFLVLSVFFTSLFAQPSGPPGEGPPGKGPPGMGDTDRVTDPCYRQSDRHLDFCSVPRSLLAFGRATAGGGYWLQETVRPLIRDPEYRIRGLLLLLSVLISIFGLGNMVLGVWIRQIIIIGSAYDKNREHADIIAAEAKLQDLFKYFQEEDQTAEGRVSCDTIRDCVERRKEVRKVLHELKVTPEDLYSLHLTIDVEGTGLVGLDELMLSILKLSGMPMSVDMLSFDFQQKMLLREIAEFERDSEKQWEQAIDNIEKVHKKMSTLGVAFRCLRQSVQEAQKMLSGEIESAEQDQEKKRQKHEEDAFMLKVLQERKRDAAHRALRERVANLRRRVGKLQQAKQLRVLCSGKDPQALRQAVRSSLETEVGPWLSTQIAGRAEL